MAIDFIPKNLQVIRIQHNLTHVDFEESRVKQMEALSNALASISSNMDKFPAANSHQSGSKENMAGKAQECINQILILSQSQFFPHVESFGEPFKEGEK